MRKDKERHFCSRFLPPQDLKVAVAVCRSNWESFLKLRNGSCKHNNAFVLTYTLIFNQVVARYRKPGKSLVLDRFLHPQVILVKGAQVITGD